MQTITPTQIQPILQAIINFYGGDFDRVSDFYNAVLPQLHGTHPLTDAVLDALADWLAEARFAKYDKPKLEGWQDIINASTGEHHTINFDDMDWDELLEPLRDRVAPSGAYVRGGTPRNRSCSG